MIQGLPGGPVVKNKPANAEDMRSISSSGTKIVHAVGQLSPCATNTEPAGLEPVLHNKRSHSKEKPAHCN